MRHWLVGLLGMMAVVASAATKPGLIGEYFRFTANPDDEAAIATMKPFWVAIDKQVNFQQANGNFNGSKLADKFIVRWTGMLKVEQAGEYGFSTESDDGSRLYVNNTLVVDHWGAHSMAEKGGTIRLEAGVHPIRVTYQELGGEAGCILRWTPPGGKKAVVPAASLSHDPEVVPPYDAAAWKKAKAPGGGKAKGGGMAYKSAVFGPFQRTAVALGEHAGSNNWQKMEKENTVYRAIVIPLSDGAEAGMVFDADTMRMAVGWTAGGMQFQGLPFTGAHAPFPSHNGERVWEMDAAPGWANADGSIGEPRQGAYPPLGNLPKNWAHYKGLYRQGARVTLAYTVGEIPVLESPSYEEGVLIRNFEIGKHGPMTIVLANAGEGTKGGEVGVIPGEGVTTVIGTKNAPAGSRFMVQGGKLCFQLAAGDGGAFRLGFWRGETVADGSATLAGMAAAPALKPLTAPGPRLWSEAATTKGVLGKEDAAYVIDKLTVPSDNPWGTKMRIGGMDFFSDGTTAAVSTWDGDVYLVKGIDEDLDNLEWSRFAGGGHELLGLKIVDDVVYTVSDAEITRYHDFNDDGEADFYENFNSDWDLTSGFHAFCFDLHTDPQGNFLFGFGAPVRNGGRSFMRLGRHHGSVLKVSKDGSQLARYAHGFRAPNGIGVGPDGQVTTGDNEGTFVPRSPLNWVQPGSFNGVIDTAQNREAFKTTATIEELNGGRDKHLAPEEAPKPLVWMPKNIDNSGGGQVWVTGDKWGPLADRLLHMSYGRSALYLAMKEAKGDLLQGAVTPFPLRFTSSCMRARMNPRDGQLYVAGLRGWQTNAAKDGGFDRVRYTGKPVAMPVGMTTSPSGIELTFSDKLEAELANDPTSFSIRAADITWTQGYGSGEYKIGNRGGNQKKGWSTMTVTAAALQPDGKTVKIAVEGMQPVHMIEVSVDLETEDGQEIITKLHGTIHKL